MTKSRLLRKVLSELGLKQKSKSSHDKDNQYVVLMSDAPVFFAMLTNFAERNTNDINKRRIWTSLDG